MAVKMLPQVVANAFVKQYYAILNKCPENAHKFYQESSLLGWPGADGVLTPVTTLSDNVKMNFSQTFFLAKQEKGFFVLNDILRFSDVFVSTANAPADYDGINDQPATSMQSSVVAPSSNEKVTSVIVPALSEKVPSVAAPASNSTQKITYASVVAKETPAISPRTARVASNVNKQVASPTTKASAPLVDRASKAATPASAVPKTLTPSNKVSPNPAPPGNGLPNNSAYSEGRLPYDITKQGIVDVVKQFGQVRRNADTIQIRRHEVHHVKFGDKEAYITYKRSYSNRGNDGGGRSPTRAGSRNSNLRGRENQARDNGRFQNENRADHNKGQTRGRRHNRRPSDQWSREASRDR
ncbi:UNVERIFIED_CONTAM: Nuclear transport factor 2 [Sesamum angustifolium]|uniref:Nuclear transport factor 2 n=1 Tax=Sesamum angustifolium TaxID=2727405 RepID=A0AAW2K7W7_9LAMI